MVSGDWFKSLCLHDFSLLKLSHVQQFMLKRIHDVVIKKFCGYISEFPVLQLTCLADGLLKEICAALAVYDVDIKT